MYLVLCMHGKGYLKMFGKIILLGTILSSLGFSCWAMDDSGSITPPKVRRKATAGLITFEMVEQS
jgi:hypothetical protein